MYHLFIGNLNNPCYYKSSFNTVEDAVKAVDEIECKWWHVADNRVMRVIKGEK